jgi:hypothetical protein
MTINNGGRISSARDSFGLGGLRRENHVLLAGSGLDLDGDLLWAWSLSSIAGFRGDADRRNGNLCDFSKRGATGIHGGNGAIAIGDNGRKTALGWPSRAASCGNRDNRLVDAGNLTGNVSVKFRTVVPGRVTRIRLTVVRRT